MLRFWRKRTAGSYLFYPVSLVFRFLVFVRRLSFILGMRKIHRVPVPVIVVGNITVGGTGKTPFVEWLSRYLTDKGYRPGILTRGYGGRRHSAPLLATTESLAKDVGDEPLLLARNCNVPVMVSVDRVKGAEALLNTIDCNIIICDDSLQHYKLGRVFEICLIDIEQRFGNGFMLPAGPLREPISRLRTVDLVIHHGETDEDHSMSLETDLYHQVANPNITLPLSHLKQKVVHAVAGIGYPDRFFRLLHQLDIKTHNHPFPDHYPYSSIDFSNMQGTILMTQKDAVKCEAFADKRFWFLPVTAKPSQAVIDRLDRFLKNQIS